MTLFDSETCWAGLVALVCYILNLDIEKYPVSVKFCNGKCFLLVGINDVFVLQLILHLILMESE